MLNRTLCVGVFLTALLTAADAAADNMYTFTDGISNDVILGFDGNGNPITESSRNNSASLWPSRTLSDRIVPPSPEAAGMAAYIDASMNYSDGTATISVPLVAWAAGSINMDLRLDYHIRGYKHDETAGWFGMGWTLNGTGAVSRSIVNLPDEYYGYETHSSRELIHNMPAAEAGEYLRRIELMQTDSHLDRYSYYCPGGSGSFVVLDGKVVQLPASDNVIEYTSAVSNSVTIIDSFTVTTPDGTKYHFAEKEHCRHEYQALDLMQTPYRYSFDAITTWHLSRITSADGDIATYKYDTMPSWTKQHKPSVRVYSVMQTDYQVEFSSSRKDIEYSTASTTYYDTRIIKSITTLRGCAYFIHETRIAGGKAPSMRVSGIRFTSNLTDDVSVFSLKGNTGVHGTLQEIQKHTGGKLADRWQFSYYGSYGYNHDFFGYCNNGIGSVTSVIDPDTGKFNEQRRYSLTNAMAGAMRSWTTFTGAVTTIGYEAATLLPSGPENFKPIDIDLNKGNGLIIYDDVKKMDPFGLSSGATNLFDKDDDDTLNPHIGIRINSLSTYDPVTLERRERKFEYLDAMCNIDLKGLVHTDFKSLSGSYDIVMSAGNTLKVLRKTSSVTLLESSRGVGYAPENARLFYGKVRERVFDYGDSLAVIMNEYNYDTDICRLPGISGGGIPKKDSLITKGSFLFDIMLPITSPKYRGEMFNCGIVNGYYRETIGAQPLLKSCVSYRLRDTTYIPERTVIYAYELCDSVSIPAGTFHEPVVRNFGNTKMRSYNYKSYCDFSFFQYEVLAFRPLLRATSEYTHFPDGASRHNTSHFIYTSDSTYSAVCGNSIPWAIGLYSNGSWNALPSPGSPLRPFKADSLDAVTAARLPFGVISVVGGNAIERYTATSANARSGFFADVAAGGRLTLPIATMWVLNGCDTLLQHNEYVKSGNRINLSRTSLGVPGHHPISVQSFNKGYRVNMPLGMKQTGSPQKTYTWDSCDQLTSISIGEGPDALTSSYTYDNYVGCTGIYGPAGDRQTFSYSGGRLATVRNNLGKLTTRYEYEFLREEGVSTFTGTNSIRTTTYGSDSDSSSVREIYDAFGLPIVTFAERVADGSDLISVRRFDALGRQLAAWRPLMVTDSILIGGIRNPYDYVLEDESQIQYGQKEACDRTAYIGSTVVHQRAGREFAGHPDSLCVLCSNPDIPELRVVRYMLAYGKLETGIRKPPSGKLADSDVYSHGELNCVKSTDADGRVSLTFSDANGRTVLVRAIGDKGEFADTYTLYNSWGDPVVVLPPSYSANLARNPSSTNLARYSSRAYLYTYDRQHRLRSKKAPGQQPVEFVYDIEGRQAFSRDGSQKEAGIRSFMLYDHLGRVAVTGTCSDSGPDIWDGAYLAPAMDAGKPGRQGDVSTLCATGYTPSGELNALLVSPRLLSASYYDNYSSVIHQLPAEAIAEPKGMCTATLTAILDKASWQPVLTTMYYDSSMRLIRSTTGCPLSGSVQCDYRYNAHGTLLSTDETFRQTRQIGVAVSHSRSFTNDHLGRPATESLKYGSRGFKTRSYSYNSLGQLYRTTGYGNDLGCTYSYNINGWLTQWSTPFATERYAYGYSPVPSYSGKISMRQTSKGSGFCNQYVYSYDRLGRLTNAAFTNLQDSEVDYSASYTYDIDSNPLTIKRSGLTDVGVYGTVNDIKIEYDNRRPRGVSDATDAPLLEGIFAPPPSVAINRTHEYDCAGRLTRDATRGIDSIRYNVIGLPQAVYFADGGSLEYTYMADGTKLRETRRRPSFTVSAGSSGIITETTDYIGSYELEGGVVRRLCLPTGFVSFPDSVYHHYITDIQGNIAAVINTKSRTVEQRTTYYPYGMPHGDATGAGINRRKFSGKELVTFRGFDAMDYHARWRGLSLPLFDTPDPLQHDYTPLSPYMYCGGDPVNRIDPSGCEIRGISKKDAAIAVEDFRAMFPGDEFADFRNLIVQSGKKQNGKSIAPIPEDALSAAFSGITLNEDQQALMEIAVNAINSKDKHYVEYRNADDVLSYEGQKAFLPGYMNGGISNFMPQILECTGGLPLALIIKDAGFGATVHTKKGSHSVIVVDGYHPNGRAVTTGHEILGHGRSWFAGYRENYQHVEAIRTENLILRVMGIPFINNGKDHGPKIEVPQPSLLPIFR